MLKEQVVPLTVTAVTEVPWFTTTVSDPVSTRVSLKV
jgi:hypothetical protein